MFRVEPLNYAKREMIHKESYYSSFKDLPRVTDVDNDQITLINERNKRLIAPEITAEYN